MKKIIIKGLPVLLILVFISCASRDIRLVNLATKELPSETELILTTTDPVQYEHSKLENPPCIIIKFPENQVFSSEGEELIINKGAIKKIKYEYNHGGSKGQPQLDRVKVELIKDLPYKISHSGSSIIIRIKNPEKFSSPSYKEKVNIELQPSKKDKNPALELGYLIGPGDVLNIEVWKHPDISREVTINYRGEIRLPPIKTLSVIGLNATHLEEKLTEALSKYLIDPIVFVTVKEYNSQRIIVLGETAAGIYTLKRKTTLVEFLGQIGGPTEDADIFHIKLIKKNGRIFTYDLNELISSPQKSDEAMVSGGDTVYVPPLELNKIYVLGEVQNPKVINIKGKMTLVDAITDAGGYTREAVTRSVMIIRGELGSQKGIRVNLSRILKEGDVGQNIELQPGDIVYVPRSFIVDLERFIRVISAPIFYWVLLR